MGKVLITGVISQLGLQLAEDLLQNGHEVIGFSATDKNKEVFDLQGKFPLFKIIEGDVFDHHLFTHGFSEVTEIYHIPNTNHRNQLFTSRRTETLLTQNILKLAYRNCAKVNYISIDTPCSGTNDRQCVDQTLIEFDLQLHKEVNRLCEISCYEFHMKYGTDIRIIKLDDKKSYIHEGIALNQAFSPLHSTK